MTPFVPVPIQHLLEHRAGALAYAPTRAPLFYRYLSYSWDAATRTATVRIHDKHYRPGNTRRSLVFSARPFGGSLASCANGNEKSYQVDGNRVFSMGGTVAWRCVRGANGRLVKLTATSQTLPASTIAIVVSSGKRLP